VKEIKIVEERLNEKLLTCIAKKLENNLNQI
jgi:hypothetical protein